MERGQIARVCEVAGTEMFWIAGLSLFHWLALFHFGAISPLALGPQWFINNHFVVMAESSASYMALAGDVSVAMPFLALGVLARRGERRAILAALVLYALDGLLVTGLVLSGWRGLMDYVAVVVHGYFSWVLWGHWRRVRQLEEAAHEA